MPRQLRRALGPYLSRTAQEMGWVGVKNGSLLELAAKEFDVLFTVDEDFANLSDTVPFEIAVVVLRVGDHDFRLLTPHMAAVNEAIRDVTPGSVRRIP